jgi:hypothetical protein|nr:MAG TPA: DNA-directed RNA polymerase [Caudoviricetes sp.]
MTTYVQKRCKVCNAFIMVDKEHLYTGYTPPCGHEYKEEAPIKAGQVMPGIVSGRVSASSEFKNFVDRVFTVKGANHNLRKY